MKSYSNEHTDHVSPIMILWCIVVCCYRIISQLFKSISTYISANKTPYYLVCLLAFYTNEATAVDPGLDWKTLESSHIYLHFSEGNKAIAEKALAIAEAAHQQLSKQLNWNPLEKTHIVISDETDFANGYATPLYFNRSVLYVAPPTGIKTLEDFDDWFSTLILHEYVHVIHLDKSAGSPEWLRNIFGRFVFLFPNVFQPSWIQEGLATYIETDIQRGIGRGQSTMFASMMREEVSNGVQPISHVNLPVSTWPAGTTRYLYGVYFMTFLTEKYGEEKLYQWIEAYSDNLLPFFINSNAKSVLAKDLSALWVEFEQWLQHRFQPQIDEINAQALKPAELFSAEAYRTDTVHAVSTGTGQQTREEIYYVQNAGYKRPILMLADSDGEHRELLALNTNAGIDVHPQAGILLTQDEFCNNYTIYSDIYVYDKNQDELKRLTKCGRYLTARWLPDGQQMIAVHHEAGYFEIQLLDHDAQLQQVLWKAEDGEIIAQIDISDDVYKLVASIWRKGKGWNIELFDLQTGLWQPITSGIKIAAYPQFTEDGNILFSHEDEFAYNLYLYDNKASSMSRLTNLTGGAFQSSQAKNDSSIYYAGYSAEGYGIYRLQIVQGTVDEVTEKPDQNDFPQRNTGTEVSPTDDKKLFPGSGNSLAEFLQIPQFEKPVYSQSNYSALSNIYPRWWFPEYQYSDQRSEFGLTTSGSDALELHNYSITASYDFKLSRIAAQLSYAYADRVFLSGLRINEISLDINSDLERVSERSVVSAVLAFPDRLIQTQSDLLISLVYDKTADAKRSAGAIPQDDFEENLAGIAWLYDSTDINMLSISQTDGMNLRLVAEDSEMLNSDFDGQVFTLDWQQYIRTGKESVFALRFLQGWGTGLTRPFKLGGEGINDDAVTILFGDSNQAVFNARNYALRGYKEGLPQLRGRRAQLLTAEWRFPLQRIEKGIMVPPVGIMQWSGKVFTETGSAYRDTPDRYYSSAGVELLADINVFYGLTLRTHIGYAHGFDSSIGEDRVYLKIGGTF